MLGHCRNYACDAQELNPAQLCRSNHFLSVAVHVASVQTLGGRPGELSPQPTSSASPSCCPAQECLYLASCHTQEDSLE